MHQLHLHDKELELFTFYYGCTFIDSLMHICFMPLTCSNYLIWSAYKFKSVVMTGQGGASSGGMTSEGENSKIAK